MSEQIEFTMDGVNALPLRKPLTEEERKERIKKYYQENREKKHEYNKKYHQENKEKRHEYDKKYRQENKEKKYEYNKKYCQENIERVHEYRSKYHQENREKMCENHKKYYQKNIELCREKGNKYNQENREKIFEKNNNLRKLIIKKMGEKCVKCGFNDYRALQIDHINGGGGKERKLGRNNQGKVYRTILLSSMEEIKNKYQLLCANCNWIKKCENDETTRKKVKAIL
jgi:hypothetical protein